MSQSKIKNQKSKILPPAFTVIEMLTTVAALIIALGLMVSLARHVREQSAVELTQNILASLDELMEQYLRDHGEFPDITPLMDPDQPLDEAAMQRNARSNNREFMLALRRQQTLTSRAMSDLPISVYDEIALRDAWGSPVVYMAAAHPAIGTAGEKPFFVSAGPDRKLLTIGDNLYSYEASMGR